MISKSLSTSERFADLTTKAGALGEFCQGLYPLIVAHADDFGRLQGDPFTVKHRCHPTSPRSIAEFSDGLRWLHEVGLIVWYGPGGGGGRKYIEVVNFEAHQQGLRRRTESTFPAPDGQPGHSRRKAMSAMDASEEEIEVWLVALLKEGRLLFSGLTVTSVDQQVRRESSYFDILATTSEGPLILIEVKRQRVTEAAIAQVLKYRDLLGRDVVPVVIGSGLAVGQLSTHKALIATYDDDFRITPVTSVSVKSREITLTYMSAEENRTEENLTEEKRSVSSAVAEPAVLTFPTVGLNGASWALTQKQVSEWQSAFPGIDILAEARKALAWLHANPGRRKTTRGMPAFLVKWFNRTTDSGRGRTEAPASGFSKKTQDLMRSSRDFVGS